MKLRGLVLCVLGMLLAGCTHVTDGGGKAASRMVTAADAERILGGVARLVSSSEGQASSPPGGRESRCEYVGADRASLTVVINTAPSEDLARGVFAESRRGLGSFEHIEEVSSIGDEAFLSKGPTARRLVVRKKDAVFLIEARLDKGGEPSLDEMKKTATRLSGQL